MERWRRSGQLATCFRLADFIHLRGHTDLKQDLSLQALPHHFSVGDLWIRPLMEAAGAGLACSALILVMAIQLL